jgi:hypothetical protein
MKKLVSFLFIVLLSLVTYSQTSLSQEELNKLPIDVQNQIKSVKTITETDTQVENIGKWVGLGKEVGYAFDGALTAITKTASDFSETKLGKITMFLVIYKVIGEDIIQIAFGFIWIILVIFISYFVHRNYAKDKRLLKKETYNADTKKYDREWVIQEGNEGFAAGSVAILIIGLLISIPIFLV